LDSRIQSHLPIPEDAWRFLTGDKKDIHKLAEAIGFNFKRVGEDFEHPVSLVILSEDGKIIRYMYGTDILPFELKLALIEASQGRIGPAVAQLSRITFTWICAVAVSCMMIQLFGIVESVTVRGGFFILAFWLVWKGSKLLKVRSLELPFHFTFKTINSYVLLVMFLLALDHLL
jgi:protein SCO1/2